LTEFQGVPTSRHNAWLLIGRTSTPFEFGGTATRRAGVMKAIKGNIFAIPAFAATVVFGSSAWIKMRC
jgi:hypothetical protein